MNVIEHGGSSLTAALPGRVAGTRPDLEETAHTALNHLPRDGSEAGER